MKKKIGIVLSIIIVILINYKDNLFSMITPNLHPDVQKINDDLYVGKVADDFYLAMERIDNSNIDMWREYALKQNSGGGRMNLKYLPSQDGSAHFKSVLDLYKQEKISLNNELWIAYASNKPITQKAQPNVYDANATNPNIEMYVTVITSPNALLTSHMGISRTWEAAYDLEQKPPKRSKHPNQSIYLHSFAAKVMKLHDPKKAYMLTMPTNIMRDILIKKMPPHSVFVGDNLYKEKLLEVQKNPQLLLDEVDLEEEPNETPQEREERLKESAQETYKFLKINEKLPLLKTNPPHIIRTQDKKSFTILDNNQKPIITFDKSSPVYQWLFTEPYYDTGLHLPYVLVDLNQLAQATSLVH